MPPVVGCLRTMERGLVSIGLSLLPITRRPQDDLLAGWGRFTALASNRLAEPGVPLGRLPVALGRRHVPCFGREVSSASRCVTVDRRVVSFTRRVEPLAGGVLAGPGRPRAGQVAVVVISQTGARAQVAVAGGLIGVCRQLVTVGGDLVAVGAALVTIRARLFAVGLGLFTVSLGLLVVGTRLLDR